MARSHKTSGFYLCSFTPVIFICFGSRDMLRSCLDTKEPKSQGCKEKISLWLEFQPLSMPSAAG